jgi:hypothetical protein
MPTIIQCQRSLCLKFRWIRQLQLKLSHGKHSVYIRETTTTASQHKRRTILESIRECANGLWSSLWFLQTFPAFNVWCVGFFPFVYLFVLFCFSFVVVSKVYGLLRYEEPFGIFRLPSVILNLHTHPNT